MSYPPPWTGIMFTSKLHSTPSPEIASLKLPTPFVAVITGGSRNIGAATAKALARAGATGLIITATNLSEALLATKKEIEAISSSIKVTVLAADQSEPSSAEKIAEAIKAEHGGRLDALINNAAVVSTHPSAYGQNNIAAIEIDQLATPMSVNLVGKFAVIKALLPLLLETEGGAKSIVNVTSALSHFASMQAMGYNLSQLATNRLTEAVAECYGDRDILAFAVHPGIVATLPRPIGMPEGSDQMAVDDAGLCGGFLVWLLRERKEWLSGRYLSANWDVDELESKKEEIVKGDKLKMRMTT